MSYLGIYEWVYEKILSSIVTPVFDFVASIINIAWGYIFQHILGPVLLPVFQIVFYWVIRVIEILGAFMNYLRLTGYPMVVDCLEKAFDTLIGLEPVTYHPNGRGGAAVTGNLSGMPFTSAATSEAFEVITLGGVGIASLLTIFRVAKSSFGLDFEDKRPVSHVFRQLFEPILGAFLIPFAAWSMIQLSVIILTTPNTAVSFDDSGGRSTLGSIVSTAASVNAAWDNGNNVSKWGTVGLDEGFGFKVLGKANPDFDVAKEPRKNFYLNDTCERYTNIPDVVLNFDLSRFDYLMGGWTAIFLCVTLFLCFLTIIRRVFETLLLYLVSPYFVTMTPPDDKEKFEQWFGTLMGKLFTGYDTVILMKIRLILMPLILRGGIIVEGMGGENRTVMAISYVMGGAWTVYGTGSLLTGPVNEAAKRLEQESNRDAYGAAMFAAAPFRTIKNRLEQKISGKLEKKTTDVGKDVGTWLQGGNSRGSGTRSEVRTDRLRSKPLKQPRFKEAIIHDELKNSFGSVIGGYRPARGRPRQPELVSKAVLRNVKRNTSRHIDFENDRRPFKYDYDQFRKDNVSIRNKNDTVDFMYLTKRKSIILAQGNEIAEVRKEALSYSDPKERSQYATNWLQYQPDDESNLMYFNPVDRMRLERTFGCKIDETPISSGINKGQIAFYPEKPKLPSSARPDPDKSKGDKR